MPHIDAKFTLRAMQPSDSGAVTNLITAFDGGLTTRFLLDAYTAITAGTEYRTVGVVVECAGQDGLVGMGTVRFSQAQYNGQTLPLAFLDGLKVHRAFRGQGLGYAIANWRVQLARETYGAQCVIATGMLHDNRASYAVAKKWCREFVKPAFNVVIVPTRTQPPKPLAGVSVCEIVPGQYEACATEQREYYKHYNLYPPASAHSLVAAREVSADGRKPYRFFAAVDTHGNLLAGPKPGPAEYSNPIRLTSRPRRFAC
jgi:predicted N-acetyltransferase YhbS